MTDVVRSGTLGCLRRPGGRPAGTGEGILDRTTDAGRRARASARATAAALILVAALAGAASGDLDRERFVPVDELRPGDRCTGRTVFSGNTVEEFDVEIVGVVRGTGPQSDLIIARASGGPLGETGILEGMSGSPVYLGDRLVGAISSTWAFSKEALAGVTPIGEMLPALDALDAPSRSGSGTGGAYGALVVPSAERAVSRAAWLLDVSGRRDAAPGPPSPGSGGAVQGGGEFSRISLPLVVSCGSDAFLRDASGVLAGSGFTPMRGFSGTLPGAAAAGGASVRPAGRADGGPVPGSAVGVQLVRGDADWTAIGTLTHREGDRVLAFGHPLFQAGDVELPLVDAYVHALMPLQSVSFKYASGSDLVGTMFQDRRHMVAGALGAPPAMVALTVGVALGGGEPRVFDLEVVRARPYASLFAGLAAAGVLDEVARSSGAASVEMRARVSTDAGVIEYSDTIQTADAAFRVGGELAALMDLVLSNAFEPRTISDVSLDVRVLEEERWAEIERVDVDRPVCRPGEDVTAAVTLRCWQGPVVTERLTLRVPESAPDGTLVLRVAGGQAFRESERERLGDGLRPRSYEQLVSLIERSSPGNAIVAQLLSEDAGLSLAGEEMRGLPGRAALAMAKSAVGGVVDRASSSCLAQAETALDREVRGSREVVITVGRTP